jgi:metal-responsive CopG/Arc/MetJ family transcriptional regulator
MPRRGYRSLTIPEGLYSELKKYFDKSNDTYVTMSEVVREALREYLKNHS